MNLKERIKLDVNSALKQGKSLEVSTLRQLLAAVLNKEKADFSKKEKELTDQELIEIIFSELKKRKESIKEFEKGDRPDLMEKEKQEVEILEKYLPEQLNEEEIKKLVIEAIEKTQAKEIKDIGKIMSELIPKLKGKADNSLISKIVKQQLTRND